MDIYWVKDGRRCGPATVPDVISLVHLGELSADTLGWHSGCKSWAPLRELPALCDFLTPKPEAKVDAPAEEAAQAAPETQDTPPVPSADPDSPFPPNMERVWLPTATARLMARAVDVALYMGLVYSAIYVQQLPYDARLLPSSPLFWLGFIAAEAALIAFFGTTPGKSFYTIRVVAFQEGASMPIGLLRSLGRALMVFVGGMGMMCSFLPFVMSGFSWWMLKRHGITYWDARMSTFPAQSRRTGLPRHLLAALLIFFCMEVIGLCLQPWLPSVMEELQAQSPEAAQTLQQLMPELPAAPAPKP